MKFGNGSKQTENELTECIMTLMNEAARNGWKEKRNESNSVWFWCSARIDQERMMESRMECIPPTNNQLNSQFDFRNEINELKKFNSVIEFAESNGI